MPKTDLESINKVRVLMYTANTLLEAGKTKEGHAALALLCRGLVCLEWVDHKITNAELAMIREVAYAIEEEKRLVEASIGLPAEAALTTVSVDKYGAN